MVEAAGKWFMWDSAAMKMGSPQKKEAWGSTATLGAVTPQLVPWWPHQPGRAELSGAVGAGKRGCRD